MCEFVEPVQGDLPCPVPSEKISLYACRANHLYKLARPIPNEGRIAIVTDAGWDAVDAAASGASVSQGGSAVSEKQRAGRTALQRLRQNLGRSTWPVEAFG